jgi:hypothetical protein
MPPQQDVHAETKRRSLIKEKLLTRGRSRRATGNKASAAWPPSCKLIVARPQCKRISEMPQ